MGRTVRMNCTHSVQLEEPPKNCEMNQMTQPQDSKFKSQSRSYEPSVNLYKWR